jgi:hypothetical protein
MRTTDKIPVLCFCAALVLAFSLGTSQAQQTPKQVKLVTDAVEVVDLSPGAAKCPDQKEASTVRLRVKSEKPVDVAVYLWFPGGWSGRIFANKSTGDEFEHYGCVSPKHISFKVYARDAGSQQDWPKKP